MALLSRARTIAERMNTRQVYCPTCLLELAVDLSNCPGTLEQARKDVHGLWDGLAWAFSFDLLDREGRRRDKVVRALVDCARHNAELLQPRNVLHDFIAGVCACLHVCLSVGETSAVQRSATRKRAFENRGGHWPMRSDALFPIGEHAGVQAALFWSVKLDSPYPLLLLADMLRIAHPLVFGEIAEGGVLRNKAMLAILARLGEFGRHRDGVAIPTRTSRAHLPPVSPLYRRENMEAAVSVLAAMWSAPDALPNSLLQIAEHCEMALFTGLQLVLDALYEDDPLFDTVLALCAAIYNYAPAQELGTTARPDVLQKAREHETLGLFGVLHRALAIVALNRRICARENCSTPIAHVAPDAYFRVCARCQFARYCSKECQKGEWMHGTEIPHRTVCPLICKLMAVASVEMAPHDFEAAAETLDWDPSELWALSLFTLGPRSLPMEILFRAADIHRDLLVDSLPEASAKALASVEELKTIMAATKARYLQPRSD
ncbi:hypothetical protein AURDEDRAFT_116068 [Auricularia subglabra TFB-10046 SS5]|nr:hypothetical protein AURDEDRAFT_116068 [Auricularia subglabra TFB-10046 SS5]